MIKPPPPSPIFPHPSLTALHLVSTTLTRARIPHALGGSGLLAALGLADRVRDWDLTTDCSPQEVLGSLPNVGAAVLGPNGPFLTQGLVRLNLDGAAFDIICRFAIRHERGAWAFPTIRGGIWQAVPLSRPEPWLVAYMLLGREPRVAALRQHLREVGADAEVIRRLRRDSLPREVDDALAQLGPECERPG